MLKKELELELNRTKLVLDYAKNDIEEKDKQLDKYKNVIDKIKEIALAGVEVNKSMGVKVKTGDDKILELLEEVE